MPLYVGVACPAGWAGATPGAAACSDAPQLGQNVAPSGTCCPHFGQNNSWLDVEYLKGPIYCIGADLTVRSARQNHHDEREGAAPERFYADGGECSAKSRISNLAKA